MLSRAFNPFFWLGVSVIQLFGASSIRKLPCYDILCRLQLGYYLESENNTMLLFRTDEIVEQICLDIKGAQDWFCYKPHADGVSIIPGLWIGLIDAELYQYVEGQWSQPIPMHFYTKSLSSGILSESFEGAWIDIEAPINGVVLTDQFYVGFLSNTVTMRLANALRVSILDISEQSIDPGSLYLESDISSVEPGTLFFTLVPVLPQSTSPEALPIPNEGHLELILSVGGILSNRLFANQESACLNPEDKYNTSIEIIGEINNKLPKKTCGTAAKLSINSPAPKASTNKTINICIWGSNKLDGQKSIWIQQVKY